MSGENALRGPPLERPSEAPGARRWLHRVLLVVTATAITLVAGEIVFRLADDYRLDRLWLLRARRADPLRDPLLAVARGHVQDLPVADGVDRAWFMENPPPLPREKPLAETERRYMAAGRPSLEAIYSFNREWARARTCQGHYILEPWMPDSPPPDRFVYPPEPDPDRQTRFRLPAAQTLPDGLVVNRWGFLGRDLPLNRPPRTIRIAFAGASTTVSYSWFAYRYPDYVEHWLDRWARSRGLDVRFDIINAGRNGFGSDQIAAAVRWEVLPFDPDLVVYYEGSNQFYPAQYVEFPEGVRQPPPEHAFAVPTDYYLLRYSAMARRATTLLWLLRDGREPAKPEFVVRWPDEVDELDPDLSARQLFPSRLGQILGDLDYIREHTEAAGGELVLTTFVWLVKEGLVFDLPAEWIQFDYLNRVFHPFSYAHLRRHADFQNRVYRKYAQESDIELLDVDALFPRDTRLHIDAIHLREAGVRLRAWVITQLLVPILESRLADGRLPRPVRQERLTRHPILSDPPSLVRLEELRSECPPAPS